MPTLYLIDGNSYIYRAFYAVRGLTASDGTPTNAIYGFINMVFRILREKRPDYFSIVFDTPGPTHRHEAYEEYKAHRPGMPDELKAQIPLIKEIVDAFRIHTIEMEGYEADDLLGTIAKMAESDGFDVLIVTGDKDMCQVVSPRVKLYDSMKEKITGEKDVIEKYGVPPGQFPEIIALMGDASDNIPGAPGIGEKTAVKLLKEFGDLNALLERHEDIKNTRARNSVAANKDNIKLSKELATIHSDIQLGLSLDELKRNEPDWARLRDFFRALEFSSLARLIPQNSSANETKTEYITVHDKKVLKDLIKSMNDDIAIDTETTSEDPMKADLVGISLSASPEKAYYIPLAHSYDDVPEQLDKKEVIAALKGVIEDSAINKTGHNIKYDLIILKNEGLHPAGIHFDTMVASYLLNPNKANHNLAGVAMERLGMKKISFKDVLGKDKKDFSEVDIDRATEYSGEDAVAAFMLKKEFEPEIEKQNLANLMRDMEMPLIEVLADMEMAGVRIDLALMKKFSDKMASELSSIERRIYFTAGEEFNINSPKQLQEILFEKLGLQPTKKTKTGFSTNADVLEQLSYQHDLPREIIEFRALSKLKSTYVDALPRLVNDRTGRLHTSFNQTVTATGRLSSSNPNLQNIPVRGEWGTRIRQAFIADKGNLLLSSDYSQIELRIFAHLSGDDGLVQAFRSGGDIHTRTASEIFDVKPEMVDSDMRRKAKTVNFGIVYGISPYGLSQQLRIHPDEAKHYIDTYFSRHRGVKNYIESLIEKATEQGYVTTLYGRKRAIPELKSTNRNMKQLGERLATNTPIQGSAADIIKVSMINIWKRIKKEKLKSRMLLQVHDELLFEVPKNEVSVMENLVREEMENAADLRVPILVDLGTGRNWSEAH